MRDIPGAGNLRELGPDASFDAVVVGAGPYGLSAASHLRERGLHTAVFGKPMELWRERMPPGMFLSTHSWGTNLSDPRGACAFERFLDESGHEKGHPVPIETFIDYAQWFEDHAVHGADPTYVATIEREGAGFRLTLADRRIVRAPAVVMAAGPAYYARRPPQFACVPATLLSHSIDHGDFARFRGRDVVVTGAGQSAIEYAALLREAGAVVHVVSRRRIAWLPRDCAGERSWRDRIIAPDSVIAPGWKNCVLEHAPYLFRRLPQARKDRYIGRHVAAAAAHWLRERVIGKVTLHEERTVVEIRVLRDALELKLSDGIKLLADHLMTATGFDVDVRRLPMLHPALLADVRCDGGAPILSARFESALPGLYFIGITSLRTFGPLFRFVAGCGAAATRVTGAVAQRVRAAH